MGQNNVKAFHSSSEVLDDESLKPQIHYPKICYNTKFSRIIGQELYKLFKKFSNDDNVITIDIFNKVFPFLRNEDELLKSLFRAIDKDKGSTIEFEEFITALSTMMYGTSDEKTELTLKILDLNGDEKIEYRELLTVCSDVAKILQKSYPQNANTTMSAEEIVNKIFNQQIDDEDDILIQNMINEQDDQKTIFEKYDHFIEKLIKSTEKKNILDKLNNKGDELKEYLLELENKIKGKHDKEIKVLDLSYKEFKDRAIHEPEFLSCFGLFTLFNLEIIKPIEKQVDTHNYKLGFPSVEGEVTVLNFVEKKPYVQVLNGFMNFFYSYKHCHINQNIRWLLKQDCTVKFSENDEMTHSVIKQLKDIGVDKAVSIGIKNSTFEDELKNPKIDIYHGFQVKAPDDTITKDKFTSTLFAQKNITGVSGMMSYDIGKSGYSLFILFEVGFLLPTGLFAISVEESGANRNVVYTKLKLHVKSSGIIEHKSNENFTLKACIGNPNKKDFLTNKICLLVEIEESLEFPPPLFVLDLTEANIKRSKREDSFFLSTHFFKETEFVLENEKLLEHWLSTIQKNQEVAKLVHPSQSFSPVRTEMGARFFIGGAEYYTDLKERLKEAKNEILITGWFISPQLHLSRKKVNGKYVDRLDEILLERANAGVLVHICVWDEIDAAFKLGSKQVKEILKHENISVIRDPLDLLGIWSHHQKTCVIDQVIGYCGGIDLAYNRYETHEYKLTDEGEDQIYVGRDYVNPMIAKDNAYIAKDHQIYDTMWDRKKEPRMPWQDIQLKVVGDCARDLARNFIQRWNKSKSTSQPFLALRSHDYHKISIDALKKKEPYPNCNIQIIRSASFWSMGLNTVESSIYQSQIEAIKNSKHFIYIENQFFVSSHIDHQMNPENKLLKAFVERIERAILNKEKFRFIFVTPVHSSSPMKNSTVQKLTYWQFTSMFHGKKSLYGYFKDKYPDVNIDEYMTISCLRQHGQFKSGVISTEMIYVHSKLVIVDDRIAFISSANVNDRSMLGDRDSEIGARIEDTEEVEITMAGEKFMAKKFAHELRHKLQCLFTGADEKLAKEAIDPVLFYDKWMEIAKNNQKIYVQVFQMIEDNIKSPEDVKYLTEYNHKLLARDTHLLKELKGFVIPYPRGLFSQSYSEPSESDPTAKFYC